MIKATSFQVSGPQEITFIKQTCDKRGVLALGNGVGHYKSDFYYYSFEFPGNNVSLVKNVFAENIFNSYERVNDMCDFFHKDFIFYVTNNYNDRHELISCNMLYDCRNNVIRRCGEKSERYLFCCANSYNGAVSATGTEHGVMIFRDFLFSHEIQQNGYVSSVALNNSGDTLYCGVDTQGLKVVDLRQPTNRRLLQPPKYFPKVTEIKLLSDECTMIVCDEAGFLSKIDFRNLTKVWRYSLHVSHGRKAIISVNENVGLVCATGSDNLTRVWSLSSGRFLHHVGPVPAADTKSYASIISDQNKWFVCLLGKNIATIFKLGGGGASKAF